MHYWRGNAGRGGRGGRGNAGSLIIALSALPANSSLKLLYRVEKDFNPALLHCEVILELELLVLQFEEVLLVLPILLLPLKKARTLMALLLTIKKSSSISFWHCSALLMATSMMWVQPVQGLHILWDRRVIGWAMSELD